MKPEEIARSQAKYYSRLLEHHGPGVNAVASGEQIYKDLRYERMSRVFGEDDELTMHDVGCGLGHYYEFLQTRFPERKIQYSGSEVTPEFVSYCKERYPECEFFLRDIAQKKCPDRYDYLVFGGTFYHPCETSRSDWERFMFRLLAGAFSMARKGIAFNVITQYCDFYEKGLYYCNVSKILDFITDELSRFFTLDHSYPLYEMTILVYRHDVIQQQYPQPEYEKYFNNSRCIE